MRRALLLAVASAALAVSACGGDGDNDTPPVVVAPPPTPTPPPPTPVPPTGQADLGATFAAAFGADPFDEAIDVEPGDLPDVDPTIDPFDPDN